MTIKIMHPKQTFFIERDKPILFVMPSGSNVEVDFKDFAFFLLNYVVDAQRPKLAQNKLKDKENDPE